MGIAKTAAPYLIKEEDVARFFRSTGWFVMGMGGVGESGDLTWL